MDRRPDPNDRNACEHYKLFTATARACFANIRHEAFADMITPERILKQTKYIVLRLVQKMLDEGRLSTIEDIATFLNKDDFDLLRRQNGSKAKEVDLVKRFLLSFPQVFYVGDVEVDRRSIFVGLSRDYAYYNARFAYALRNVFDDQLETPLLWQGEGKPLLKRPDESQLEYPEYLLAKTSIAILHVLDVLEKTTSKGKIPWASVEGMMPSLKKKLGPLGEALIWYCSTEQDFETGLLVFFYLFQRVFQIDDVAIGLDPAHLMGIWIVTETDLFWSYTSFCLLRGENSVTGLTEKLATFVQKSKFKYDRVINEDIVVTQLRSWHGSFFLPGDGTIHRVPLANPCNENKLRALEKFFSEFLERTKSRYISYGRCRDVLKRRFPQSLEWEVCQSSVGIAAHLCRSGSFVIKDGLIRASPNVNQQRVLLSIGHANVEVPRYVLRLGDSVPDLEAEEITGVIAELGICSGLLLCELQNNQDQGAKEEDSEDSILAFCHISETTFRGNKIDDFTVLFDVGDRLRFSYKLTIPPHVRRPCPVTVDDIKGVDSRASDDDDIEDDGTSNPDNKEGEEDEATPRWRFPKSDFIGRGWNRKLYERRNQRRESPPPSSCSNGSNSSLPPSNEYLTDFLAEQADLAKSDESAFYNEAFDYEQGDCQVVNAIYTDQVLTVDSAGNVELPAITDSQEEKEKPNLVPCYVLPVTAKVVKLNGAEMVGWVCESSDGNTNGSSVPVIYDRDQIDQYLKSQIAEKVLRIMCWKQYLRTTGFDEDEIVPSDYNQESDGTSLSEVVWDTVSEWDTDFIVGNDASSLISILSDPRPICLVEIVAQPTQEDLSFQNQEVVVSEPPIP